MKAIVLYQSKYGAMERYAKMLATKLNCQAVSRKSFRGDLAVYDTVVYGGGIYASGIAGLSAFRKLIPTLAGKRLLVFAVGASPYQESAVEAIRKKNMQGELAEVPLFYLRGAFDESRMTLPDKLLIGMLKKVVGKKAEAEREAWERELLAAIGRPGDWISEEQLAPLLLALSR